MLKMAAFLFLWCSRITSDWNWSFLSDSSFLGWQVVNYYIQPYKTDTHFSSFTRFSLWIIVDYFCTLLIIYTCDHCILVASSHKYPLVLYSLLTINRTIYMGFTPMVVYLLLNDIVCGVGFIVVSENIVSSIYPKKTEYRYT